MNGRRIGLAVLVAGALALGLSFLRAEPNTDSPRRSRQLVLHFTLSRAENPIIILGDSIVEASTLPRVLCGHLVVNAGLSGASTASDLGTWLLEALNGKPAAAIVISLGINDALGGPHSRQQFEANYSALLAQLSKATKHIVVLSISPVDVVGGVTTEMQAEAMRWINDYNSALPGLTEKSGATFVALPPMPTPHTIDGVHMNAAGEAAWESAVVQGASKTCGPN